MKSSFQASHLIPLRVLFQLLLNLGNGLPEFFDGGNAGGIERSLRAVAPHERRSCLEDVGRKADLVFAFGGGEYAAQEKGHESQCSVMAHEAIPELASRVFPLPNF
jgi:hypothetical protein